MKSRIFKNLPWIGVILFVIELLSDLDGVLNLLVKLNITVSKQNWEQFSVAINQLMLLYLVIVTTFLLRNYFKNTETSKKLKDQRDLEQAVIAFYMRHTLQSIQGVSGTDRNILNKFLRKEMHNVWGERKTDSEINKLVEEFISKVGHATVEN